MASAQRLAARRGGSGRFLPLGHDWHDEEAITALAVERYRKKREAAHGSTRVGIHTTVYTADHDLIEWPVKTEHPERTRPAPTVPLPMPAELAEAIEDLDDVTAYAEEIEVETPSAAAFDNARRLLRAMYRISPRQFSVYPAAGGHIAIDARGTKGNIVVVSCGSDGSVLCLVTIDGEDRRARYATARTLPDGFISEALAAL